MDCAPSGITYYYLGKAYTVEFGDPDSPADFDFIYAYSPLHNIPKDRTLPPLLLMTADRGHIDCIFTCFTQAASQTTTVRSRCTPSRWRRRYSICTRGASTRISSVSTSTVDTGKERPPISCSCAAAARKAPY